MTALRVRIEQGIAQGWAARVVAVRVGVSVDLVHEVWDELDQAVGVAPPGPAGEQRPDRLTCGAWLDAFRESYLLLGSVALVCRDLGVSVHAAEMRWRRWGKADPIHTLLMWERRRLRMEAKRAAAEGVAA